MQQPRDFSAYGAVDLGARQAAAKRRQQAAQSPAGGASEYVFEATEATFNTDVVARSSTVPVIVDLWAQWCGPCKQLSPVLEKLAEEANGAWLLAEVDVDANPQLSTALQVQSIPMVIAVVGGQIVDGFLGALPEAKVRQWIGQVLAAAEQMGLPSAGAGAREQGEAPGQGQPGAEQPGESGGAARQMAAPPDDLPADPKLRAAQEALTSGDFDSAVESLKQVLASEPGHPVAAIWLAQVELVRRVNSYDPAKVHQAAEENPDDPQAQAQAADVEFAGGLVEESFERMLGVFKRVSGEDRDQIRRHLLSLFEIMPPGDPRVSQARARLSAMLF